MRFDKSTLRRFWKDLSVFLTVGLMFALIFGLGASFLKVYEDSVRVRQRARIVVSVVDEQKNLLFREQAGTAALSEKPASTECVVGSVPLRRWIIERFVAANDDPRIVSKDVEKFLASSAGSPLVRSSLKRWQATLDLWSESPEGSNENSKDSKSTLLLIDGRQHYFESAGFRRIGKSFDGTVLDLWTISILTQFIEKNPMNPAVPEALFMMGDEYMNLGSALPKDAKSDRILNLVSELYPDSIWASRANAIWKSEHVHAI